MDPKSREWQIWCRLDHFSRHRDRKQIEGLTIDDIKKTLARAQPSDRGRAGAYLAGEEMIKELESNIENKTTTNQVDQTITWFKNRKVFSRLIVAGIVIGAIAGLLNSLDTIGSFCSKIISPHQLNDSEKIPTSVQLTEEKKDQIRSKLNNYLGGISVYINYTMISDNHDAFADYYQRAMKTVSDCSAWIDQEIGFSAREIFINRKAIKKVEFKNVGSNYEQLFKDLEAYSAGLKELIQNDNWTNYYNKENRTVPSLE